MITSQDTFNVRRDMGRIRQNYNQVRFVIPAEVECSAPGCGYDSFTDSGLNPSCTVCQGKGKTLSWTVQAVRARVKRIDLELRALGVAAGVEVGDAVIYLDSRCKAIIDRLIKERRAYLVIDGECYRPTIGSPDGVGKDDEYRVDLKRASPEARYKGL